MIVDKPWGKVVTYALNQPSSVRVITVEPGQETSVHYHQMRDEMWVVLDEGLTIQIGNRSLRPSAGEEFMVGCATVRYKSEASVSTIFFRKSCISIATGPAEKCRR